MMLRRIASVGIADVLFFALSLCYLAAEFRFNITLLDVAGSAIVDPLAIEQVADFGRLVSASGFTLLALGLFANAGFKATHLRHRLRYGVLAVLCLAPFVFFPPERQEMFFVAPVLFGIFLMVISRGRWVFHTVLAVILTAWPAMYAGQKSMIEHLVVEPTTWQERQQARNLLLLKSGLEDCVVELQGRWLCQGDKSTAEVRAVRAMIAALWMHRPGEIIAALEKQRDRIIENTVAKKGQDRAADAYAKYLAVAKDERAKIVDQMMTKFYAPYEKASLSYAAAKDPKRLNAELDRIWAEMEKHTDAAWAEYKEAQARYRSTVGRVSDTMLNPDNFVFQKLDEFCATRNCPKTRGEKGTLRMVDEAETLFIRKTGFPPTLADKAEMMTYPRAREAFEDEVNERLLRETGIVGIALPRDWAYDEKFMKGILAQMFQTQVVKEWQAKFKDVPPGLPPEQFFERMKVPPLPDMNALVMDQAAFTQKYILPTLRKKVTDELAQMQKEAPLYANGQMLESKGRDYVRAVYIPAIALLLSLLIVTLTVLRGINAAMRLGFEAWAADRPKSWLALQGPRERRHLRHTVIAALVLMLAIGPYVFPNDYTQSRVYEVYLYGARQENIVTATLLDWAIHMQPMVYALVRPLMG